MCKSLPTITHSQSYAAFLVRDTDSREPVDSMSFHELYCTNPEAPPGMRHWVVDFFFESGEVSSYNGENWKKQVTMF
jgi:hypothetical protein